MEPDTQPPVPNTPPESQELLGYDANGQPLYGTPVESAVAQPTQPLRSTQPVSQAPVSDDVKKRHDESAREYPHLSLNQSEYVMAEVVRHPIGIAIPVIGGIILICILLTGIIVYPTVMSDLGAVEPPHPGIVALIGIMLSAIVAGFTYMSVWIFRANRLYLTNERIIQNVQKSLFWKRVQTIRLSHIEDASYRQNGIMPTMFGYGAIRLSTIGDENTYRLNYVANPETQVDTFNRAIEQFKNDREL